MARKMAFVYSHGGPVFDQGSHDGFNDRGRNIITSMHSAADSGCEKIFVSESVYPDDKSQIQLLMERGHLARIKHLIDHVAYPIAPHVKFPKNYLFNRTAQRAAGVFGLIFTDSDVLYQPGFPSRAEQQLQTFDFVQPDHFLDLDPNGNTQGWLDFQFKRLRLNSVLQQNFIILEGMPGLVNIAKRDTFLEVGGFSQAISGVNFEDMEYYLRLRILDQKLGYMPGEIVSHIYHSRRRVTRVAEKLPDMYFENANFFDWWSQYYLQLNGANYNKAHFSTYLKRIKDSLNANETLNGPYTNETGTIMPEYDPNQRYPGAHFGLSEAHLEFESKEGKIAAALHAARFWRIPVAQVIAVNRHHFPDITPEEAEAAGRTLREQASQAQADIDTEILAILSELEDETDREILGVLAQL